MLRRHDYSESSQILRLLTERSGVVGVLARGARREKSPFGGALDLFYRGEARIRFRPRAGLHLLTGFRVTSSHPGLRKALPRFHAACRLVKIVLSMTREEEHHPGLLPRLEAGLELLETAGEEEVDPILVAAELGLLGVLGFAPRFDACAACGGDASGRGATLSARFGGVLCARCGPGDPRRLSVPPRTLNVLRLLAHRDPRTAARVRLAPEDRRTIRTWLDRFHAWR